MNCTCNPARTFTWVDEECPTHGREAQEARSLLPGDEVCPDCFPVLECNCR